MSTDATSAATSGFVAARARLVADRSLGGRAFVRACTELTDRWLSVVYDDALLEVGLDGRGLALVALGGYGRGELCPGSDLDLLLVHRGVSRIGEVAEALWYPVWDTGLKLGHAVRTVAEAADAAQQVESATAMLDGRLLRGDQELFDDLSTSTTAVWQRLGPQAQTWLRDDAAARRARFGEVAFSVEPNLKYGHGGLRDAQVPGWLHDRRDLLVDEDATTLRVAETTLLEARVELHRVRPGSGEVLVLDAQDEVARHLGAPDTATLMARIAMAGRAISWVCDELWAAAPAEASKKRRGRGSDTRAPTAMIDATDPVAVLVWSADVAARGERLDRRMLASVAAEMGELGGVWPRQATDAFLALLRAGAGATTVIESLDHVGLWTRLLPEWQQVSSLPQRTAHHRFTTDRHLLEAVAIAATLTDHVAHPDAFLLAALLHGLDPDVAMQAAKRMGLDDADTSMLESLLLHHRLLPEVATRRDLGDAAVLDTVARVVGSVEALGMLTALTEAIARATGPAAWTEWKTGLVSTLAQRVAWRLAGDLSEQYGPVFPSVEQMLMLRAGETTVIGEGRTLTVVAPDRPGLFSRVAGVLVLRGLDVVSAEATSSEGMALEEFTVQSAFATGALSDAVQLDWPRVVADVHRAMAGHLAIEARVAERADTYRRKARSADTEIRVRFDDAVADTTMLEVDAPDGVGVLYRVTRAFAEVGVDIRQARVETLTDRVVDAFSIVDEHGRPIVDPEHRVEIERAVRHAVAR